MRDKFNTMRDNRNALRDAIQKGADEKEVRPLAEKQGQFVTEMIMTRAQMQKKVNAILTEEQRAELEKIQKERMEYRRERSDDDERGRW
jgi:Spy/CpxP family protein refolding chaperone